MLKKEERVGINKFFTRLKILQPKNCLCNKKGVVICEICRKNWVCKEHYNGCYDCKQYWVMDGRASYSIDDAICISVCYTLSEAIEEQKIFNDVRIVVYTDGVLELYND